MASGDSTAAEIQASIVVRAPMLAKYPGSAFTKRSVTEAAFKFKFWPSVAELANFFDTWTRPKGGDGGGEVGWPRRLRSAQAILAEPKRFGVDTVRIAEWVVANAPPGTLPAPRPGDDTIGDSKVASFSMTRLAADAARFAPILIENFYLDFSAEVEAFIARFPDEPEAPAPEFGSVAKLTTVPPATDRQYARRMVTAEVERQARTIALREAFDDQKRAAESANQEFPHKAMGCPGPISIPAGFYDQMYRRVVSQRPEGWRPPKPSETIPASLHLVRPAAETDWSNVERAAERGLTAYADEVVAEVGRMETLPESRRSAPEVLDPAGAPRRTPPPPPPRKRPPPPPQPRPAAPAPVPPPPRPHPPVPAVAEYEG